jgi:C4-dicarboxylate-specific signal transduction histidine kinase
LSGEGTKLWIDGEKIFVYVKKFFGELLQKNKVTIKATQAFLQFSVYERPARIFPIFINLINNSRYWVCQDEQSKRNIIMDVIDEHIIIADDGPGVEEDDLKHLFTLFFTRKIRGGRGVGLYLCRVNLAAGGHTIHYATEDKFKKLSGANFVINLKGAKYD